MAIGVKVHDKEHFEKGLRRFARAVEKSGKLAELRKHEYYEKPSVKKKRARAAAIKRSQKALAESQKNHKRFY